MERPNSFPDTSLRTSILDGLARERDPRELLSQVLECGSSEISGSDDLVWRQLYQLASSYGGSLKDNRAKHIRCFQDVLRIINESRRIVVILGAGASVGPDFRSPGGLYDTITKAGVLDDPSDVFDLDSFTRDPSIFWRFAHTIFPEEHPQHSGTHYFLQELEERGKLLRLYTQNVDALEIGIPQSKLRCVHGSWRESRCMKCGCVYQVEDIRESVQNGESPRCKYCDGLIKPGIVFFGQSVNLNDHELSMDAEEADLLLVIGTSLRVAPVSEIPTFMKNVPSILINRATVKSNFSAELLGECDDIVKTIEYELGWDTEGGVDQKDTSFFGPNKFIFPSQSELATHVISTPKCDFLATSAPLEVADLC